MIILGGLVGNIMFLIGAAAVLLKIVIGIALLCKMKKSLHGGYLKCRNGIVWTIILTFVAEIAYTLLNQFGGDGEFNIFFIYLITKKEDKDVIILRMFFSIMATTSEIFLIWFNTTQIDFKYYIYMLLAGRK